MYVFKSLQAPRLEFSSVEQIAKFIPRSQRDTILWMPGDGSHVIKDSLGGRGARLLILVVMFDHEIVERVQGGSAYYLRPLGIEVRNAIMEMRL